MSHGEQHVRHARAHRLHGAEGRRPSRWTRASRATSAAWATARRSSSTRSTPAIDPLSEKNKIILTVGPLTGTTAPMFPQACIVTKSPLTGTILNCYAGGFLGAEIKFCGIDGVVLEGAAPRLERSSSWRTAR